MNNVFLIGMPAVGKTTVGRALSKLLRCDFVDTDAEIVSRAGADIPWIFDVEGEAGFREREANVLDDLTQREHIVLATGGGAILRAANRELLAQRGAVVWLDSSDKQIFERSSRDGKRPLLQGNEGVAAVTRLREQRQPLYEEIADYRFRTDRMPARILARRIVRHLGMSSGDL
ncbi:MAG: shikimate kinase [Pseudomonadota bacterium]